MQRQLDLGIRMLLLFSLTMIQCESKPKIDFNRKIFSELKEAIKYKEDVKYLFLINRGISVISDSTYSLVNLRSLNLSLNRIREINSSICQLNNLITLHVANNDIYDWHALTCLKKLEILDLSSNDVDNIPDGVSNMMSLKELDLGNNLLREFNDEIGEIGSLKILRLDNTGLVEFPESLCDLKSLEYLDLSYNKIYSIPDKIKQLVNLESLNLEYTNIDEGDILDIQKLLPKTRIIW